MKEANDNNGSGLGEYISMADALRDCIGMPIRLNVSYKEHHCVGNIDEGELDRDVDMTSKEFSYMLLNILMTNESEPEKRKYMFIHVSNDGKEGLIPLVYEVTPCWALARSRLTLKNSIESIVAKDGLQLIPEHSRVSEFNDGAMIVIANDGYTDDEVKDMQDGPRLAKYDCRYDSEKHIIDGDIGKLVRNLTSMWK